MRLRPPARPPIRAHRCSRPLHPRPSTAAAGANGGGTRVPPPTAAAGAAGAGAAGAGRAPQQPQRAARPTSARSPQPPRPPAPAQRPSRARGAALIAVGVIAVAAIVVVLLVLTSGGTSSSHSNSASQISNANSAKHHRGGHGAAALKPSAVMVDVLNGTSTTNLAHDITQRLANAGYKTGTPATATDQTAGGDHRGLHPGPSCRGVAGGEIAQSRHGRGSAGRPSQRSCSLSADVVVHGPGDRHRRGRSGFGRRHDYVCRHHLVSPESR